MPVLGIIREGKVPADTRVAFTPRQCVEIQTAFPGVTFIVQPSPHRCIPDAEYTESGITVSEDISPASILFGIKEVSIADLIPNKTYCFFSHTKKAQPYNQGLMRALIANRITLVDYECMVHPDGERILGFGFFAGVVGAHNALLTYGKKFGLFHVPPAHTVKTLRDLIEAYEHIRIPNIKIAVTGSGRVAWGILDVMNQLDIDNVEPEDFLTCEFPYPVYCQLKGHTLYHRKDDSVFHRSDLHEHPELFETLFTPYLSQADILINGIYWDTHLPRLFQKSDVQTPDYRMNVIADVTCDVEGSVPINLRSATIADPVYGVDRRTLREVAPYQNSTDIVDVMAVDNLPNELPFDASYHFGNLLEKHILPELLKPQSDLIARATICTDGHLTPPFQYLAAYAGLS